MSYASPLIEVCGLTHRYDDGTAALTDVSLVVAPGERVGLVGPNGAGKSTLLLHLNGVLEPSAGEVRIAGQSLATRAARRAARARIGVLFQDPDDMLFTTRVKDDVAFGPLHAGLAEVEVEARVARALAAVGMTGAEERIPFKLSRGQKQRIALAALLAMEPEALCLDEPSASLDPRGRRALIALLEGLGRTLLVASHDLDLVLRLCPRVALIDRGRKIADGPAATILSDAALMDAHGLEVPAALRGGERRIEE